MTRFDTSIVHTRFDTPMGAMLAAASPRGLAGLWFHDQRYFPPQLVPGARAAWPADANHPVLQAARKQVLDYMEGAREDFDLPLDLQCGTPFQQTVWNALLQIPAGATTTYGALSRDIGNARAVRAVGAAVGRNPISIVVPCHRVVGHDGALTGYAGGLERKTALLRLEREATQQSLTTK